MPCEKGTEHGSTTVQPEKATISTNKPGTGVSNLAILCTFIGWEKKQMLYMTHSKKVRAKSGVQK